MAGADDVRRVLERAHHLEQLDRDSEAEAVLGTALASYPDDPDLHRELARHVLARGGRRHHAEGLRLAGRAVELDPHDPWNLLVLAIGLAVSPTRRGEARRLIADAAAIAPYDAAVQLARAHALEAMSLVRYGEARAAAEHAASLDPDNPDALLLLATIEHRALSSLGKESEERLRDLIGRVLAMQPDNAEALYLKARTNYAGSPAERAADFRATVALDPHHHEAIARVDSALVAPLRTGWWTLWLLALLQWLLLALGADWGAVLKVAVMVLVVLVPWLRFLAARRKSPPGFGRDDGIDVLLILFGALTYAGVLAFRLSLSELVGGGALVGCFVLLVLGGLVYRWRARRRRRRYGG